MISGIMRAIFTILVGGMFFTMLLDDLLFRHEPFPAGMAAPHHVEVSELFEEKTAVTGPISEDQQADIGLDAP